MKDTNFPPLGSAIECTLKIKDLAEIPMYEELTDELLLMVNDENETGIRKLMEIAKIEVINYDEEQHIYHLEDEIVIDAFWYIVKQVSKTDNPKKVRYLKNILYYVQNNRDCDLNKIKSFIDIIMKYSVLHFEVLWFLDGIFDYVHFKKRPLINTIPETLAECIDYAIPELQNEYDTKKQIWRDLLETGLRKEANLYMWMSTNIFVFMSLTSSLGKEFLEVVVKHSKI